MNRLPPSPGRVPVLRAFHQPAPDCAASFQLVSLEHEDHFVGTVTEKAGRLRISFNAGFQPRQFYTGAQAPPDTRVLIADMSNVLTFERTRDPNRDSVVLHRAIARPVLESLVLALAVVRHLPRTPTSPGRAPPSGGGESGE